MGRLQALDIDADGLVQRLRVIIANSAQLGKIVNEEFHRYRKAKLKQEETVVNIKGGSLGDPHLFCIVEPSVSFVAAVDLVSIILERICVPFDASLLHQWVASACGTFGHSNAEADNVTGSRVRFVIDWVLRCLADFIIKRSPELYFRRHFLVGFEHPTGLAESGLQLTGPVIHGLFGSIWLQARMRKSIDRKSRSRLPSDACLLPQVATPRGRPYQAIDSPSKNQPGSAALSNLLEPSTPSERATRKRASTMGDCVTSHQPRVSSSAPTAGQVTPTTPRSTTHVVISISKSLCKLPPESLSQKIREMIATEPLPYVLPLQHAYEDLEHLYLVYAPLSPASTCLVDYIYDLMRKNRDTPDPVDSMGFCEHTAQQLARKFLQLLEVAHGRGMVHGSLRIGGCFLETPSLESLVILEFGLYQLFNYSKAIPPLASMLPLDDFVPEGPVPPYRRDLQCVAEVTYLLLGGQPICPMSSSIEERRQRLKCGGASFVDKAFSRTTEAAKSFFLELLKPAQWQKQIKVPLSEQSTAHLAHHWFSIESLDGKDQGPSHHVRRVDTRDTVLGKYDIWRNAVRLQGNLVKLVADRITLAGVEHLRSDLQALADQCGRASWVQFENCLQSQCVIPADLLKKVSKAFGESTQAPTMPVSDFCDYIAAWRRKRVREVLWQVFSRTKAYNGLMSAESCADGLTSAVLHVWSRPRQVIEVVFPTVQDGSDEIPTAETDYREQLSKLIGSSKCVNFLQLVSKTDAA
jgi:hypothetical protein